MLVVGPEDPLVNGIYDFFNSSEALKHILVIGPSKDAAQLEGSKAFAKLFMQRNNIPTAAYKEFDADSFENGLEYIRNHALPNVLKADGLAAGKGVLICASHEAALKEFELMLRQSKFGEAGKKVVIEEFLDGIEFSMFILTNGEEYVLLPEAKDYKKIGVGDTGLNTGGMGAVSPVPFVNATLIETVINTITLPTVSGLKNEKLVYKGVVFLGLILVNNIPKVIEYNCRFGDPETEVIIPRIQNDIIDLFLAIHQNGLKDLVINIDKKTAVTVMAVSGGYPDEYEKGKVITGLSTKNEENTIVFQAATKKQNDNIVTNGGRVLTVTTIDENIQSAVKKSNTLLNKINFEGMYFRNDIGFEFLNNF
jgi:phosphoribosylamine--glycine ligase